MFEALFGGGGSRFFDRNYRAYPVAFCEKESAEKGDKIILPPSALHMLASMHVEYPMLFRIENTREGRSSHCGVLEFIAQEGMCYMPKWVMDNLLLTEGDLVNIKNVSLPKGRFIKIQPHTKDFLDISNPKAVLETSLRNFTCLTQDDTFVIDYNGRKYHIDVVEVKPDVAVSVVETDLEVDFAPPKDYVEPQRVPPPAPAAPRAADKSKSDGEGTSKDAEAKAEPEEPKTLVFGGTGRRLDGKAAGPSNPVAVPVSRLGREPSQTARLPAPDAPPEQAAKKPVDEGTGGGLKAGKVVFGDEGGIAGNRLAARLAKKSAGKQGGAAPQKPPEPKKEPKEDEGPKFVAFGGKGRSLKD